MPVIVHLPTPCAGQVETMTALGFEQRESESDLCCWHFTAADSHGLPPYNLEIQFHQRENPTVQYAVALIIKTAKQAGDQARIAKIQEALTPSNR